MKRTAGEKLFRAVRAVLGLNVPLYAANAGFFLLLSLFPGLVLALGLLRLAGLQVSSLLELMEPVVPEALMESLGQMVLQAYETSSGRLVGLSALVSVWSASKGVHGLLTGLSAVYGIRKRGTWLRRRLVSLGYTFLFYGALVLTLMFRVFSQALSKMVRPGGAGIFRLAVMLLRSRALVLPLVLTGIFAGLFTMLPGSRIKFRQNLPGAMVAGAGWLALGDLFSLHVRHFASLSRVYGSVYTLVPVMLWLYCCMNLLLWGAGLNRLLSRGENVDNL